MILPFIWGASAFGAVTVTLFFARFYLQLRDRLFAFFACAFAALSLHWLVLALMSREHPASFWVYLLRLLAFVLITAGIVDKNRER